ncbi:hypothetical protein [Psychroserpens sp. Hel_I_66]|uniref:hypothetical protein n=1 Tax=Psychroserpens sp. Hel_I_66 TaxID=1250004 RepID=UPI000646A76A|nr:hypothetical protein [Psychroserpens sp. Hel_I_66]
MRKALIIFIGVLTIFSCKNENPKTPDNSSIDTESPISLEGAWELVGYYNYKDNKITDSFQTSQGYRQVKMYTNNKVMWSKYIPSDSSEWFGYGKYNINDSELTEVLEYGSEMMTKIIQEKKEFKHELIIKENSFSQIEIDEEGNRIYAENYKRIE